MISILEYVERNLEIVKKDKTKFYIIGPGCKYYIREKNTKKSIAVGDTFGDGYDHMCMSFIF